MSFRLPAALFVTALASSLAAMPARAAPRDRVFVASYGTDSGNTTCSFEQPCRTFQNAVNNVAVGGEVTAIDSAGFGPINITQSVTITSPDGIEAGIVASGNADTIDISGSNVTVVLRGLTLDGIGGAIAGVNVLNGNGEIQIIGCRIRNFVDAGISLTPSSGSGVTAVLIKDTVVSDNENYGIAIGGIGPILKVALDEVTVNNNVYGVDSVVTAPAEVLISNSHIDNNTNTGLVLEGTGFPAPTNTAVLVNVTFNQTPTGISLAGQGLVWLSGVTQTSAPGFTSTAGLAFSASSTGNVAYSDGTNHLMGGLGGGATLQSWGMQ
jgi:hypothetical protein